MDLRSVQFRYTDSLAPKDLEQLRRLFNDSAFWAVDRKFEDLAKAISYSCPVVTAWDGETLIGFARATSDGVYRANIWDVVIHDDYQGAGFGRKLVETVLAHPHMSNVERTYLMTTNQKQFYERVGFVANETTTMVLINQPIDGSLIIRQVEEAVQ
ncbi:GNAT family N-acetyltransferase [Leptothoe sp. PORK10 BA2]|uniref:GNAT family N-acetyltransferase n=1 Tax=Leptothoe sp. PORK10 BA2 TaxID=3110254 RepID=UPI002B21EE9D|nr:GNAT family N-acetyltransferase [Leptothoe sp. PORK10 BA2]MEA5462360.1 GNAT family N-acetyltransferase [Leptothoe sp. PORK10 BA2]